MAGSTFPLPPAFYTLAKDGVDGGLNPPAPVEGEITTFGVTAHSSVAVPLLPGARTNVWAKDSLPGIQSALLQLNRELVTGLQDLMLQLEASPADSNRELEHVLAVEATMLQACNNMRPIQARATMQHILTAAVKQKEDLVHRLQSRRDGVIAAQKLAIENVIMAVPTSQ